MAITITNRALQEFTDFYQDNVNTHIRLYKTTIIFDEDFEIRGKQQIGSLDLYLTWSDDDHSFIGNSTINFDENSNRLTIDVTP